MDWVWAIPVIALVVWILAQLARGVNNANKGGPPNVQRPGQPMQRPRSSSADIDRFLEEINRRRQVQQQPQAQPAPTMRPVAPEPQRPPKQRRSSGSRPRSAPPPRRVASTIAEVLPALAVEPVVEEILTVEPVRLADHPLAAMPPVQPRRLLSPHLLKLREMLQSKDGIRAAFVLNEIIARPRCRRQG